ncbi:triose-phosphate transporter family-domain-containing protein [Coniella lustricola]|uniref:Triose-phosphate transporter family-domain-containing protein n=1 Tax=Coniella lustricola TaxID=2025994 RepID=A0A2T3AFZ4_9PEZI|nr:triose-phosphate transporter family-domain-containing protein [Coniella lustricola]
MTLSVSEKPQRRFSSRGGLGTAHPALYIACWIFFSNLTILFNKWLLDVAGFRKSISLTCWHMVFAVVATQVLARTTRLLNGRKAVHMTSRKYLRAVVPIGIVYSGSLVCSNLPYLYLSVPFIQMLKAAGPVVVLFFSWLWGLAKPTRTALLKILVIVAGVMIASAGEIRISWVGLGYQLAGLVFEALRLVMIQVLLSPPPAPALPEGGEIASKMDPLVSLYYYAPVCAAMNAVTVYLTEMPVFDMADLWRVGPGVLVLNALVAFGLNVASVFLIGKTSSLVMTLCGIFKSILLVVTGVLIWGTYISPLQLLGYFMALVGLFMYSVPSNRILGFVYELRRGRWSL